jgi:hypothetical protein
MITSLALGLCLLAGAITVPAQSIAPAYDYEDYDRAKIDRYLDVEVWTDRSDGEYYEGDNIVVHFRVNRDAFVSLYSIDTRGRVNLLFPTFPGEDNFIHGGVTYSLPGGGDDFDLEVYGPEGFENIQIIASRERFPIPDWFGGPELVADWEDRDEYMDWVNTSHFVSYGGQRFAYDRAIIYVNEWEEYYFRPVYYPAYPSWTVYGNCYIDYPWGGSIYVNGIYWGCAPLYIPHIAVGWHTISVYDHYGHCWEDDFHVSHYNTVVFNKTVIKTSPTVKSKYKEVRDVGYRPPAKHGYPDYESRKVTMNQALGKATRNVTKTTSQTKNAATSETLVQSIPKKYTKGSTKIVKTDRGYETDASTAIFPKKTTKVGSTSRTKNSYNGGTVTKSGSGGSTKESSRLRQTTSQGKSSGSTTGTRSSGSSNNRVKSGGSSSKSGNSATLRKTTGSSRPKGKSSSSTKQHKSSTKQGKSSSVKKAKPKSGSSESTAPKKGNSKVKKSTKSSKSSGNKSSMSSKSSSKSSKSSSKSSKSSSSKKSSSKSGSKKSKSR